MFDGSGAEATAYYAGNRDAASRHDYRYGTPKPPAIVADPVVKYLTDDQRRDRIAQMRREMLEASENLDFEHAAERRDSILQLEVDLKK